MQKPFFYITQFFTPEPHPKDIKYILELKKKGWDPIVITGFPNYPKGELYEGYRNKLFFEDQISDVKVIRVLTYCDHSLSVFKRTLNYLVFGLFSALAILKYGKKDSFYYILQPSPFIIFGAWIIKIFKRRSKILLDVQDVFPENIEVSGFIKNRTIIKTLHFILDKFYYKMFDLFITNSDSFRKIVISKGIQQDKVMTQYNWSLAESEKCTKEQSYQYSDDGIHIVYAGNMGVHQGLSKLSAGMLEVVKLRPQVRFHFFGDGTDESNLIEMVHGSSHFIFHGRVSGDEISKFLEAADFLFLHLIKVPIYECVIPSKLQAYVEIGKPILAGVEGEARALVTENHLGEVFESENNQDFVEAVIRLVDYNDIQKKDISLRSKILYKEKFSREVGAEKVHQFILKNI